MKRTWIRGQWDFNRRWNPLVERYETTQAGNTGALQALVRNGTEYEPRGDLFVHPTDSTKRII
ncbi:MAG TPA: hypothetical protein VKA48_07775, partial [Gammaproteobacteria bacterium]|nr:hypothetical protein [Gammaproteobacteria bacterium]